MEYCWWSVYNSWYFIMEEETNKSEVITRSCFQIMNIIYYYIITYAFLK